MFASGEAAIPAGGMQKIPEQIAAQLNPGQIRLNAAVKKIEGRKVYLGHGEILEAEKIVLATDALAAEKSPISSFQFRLDSILRFFYLSATRRQRLTLSGHAGDRLPV